MNKSDNFLSPCIPAQSDMVSTGHAADQDIDANGNPVPLLSLHAEFSAASTFATGAAMEAVAITQADKTVDLLVPGVYKMVYSMNDAGTRGGCHWAIGVTASRANHPPIPGNEVSQAVRQDLQPVYFSIKDGQSTELHLRTRTDTPANTGTVYVERLT